MSSDDIIYIVKIGNSFFGYNVMLSAQPDEGPTLDYIINHGYLRFETYSLKDAILAAQSEPTEYGYSFVNLQSFDKTANEEVE